MERAPRVAVCLTGTWRTFGLPEVHNAFARDVSRALAGRGAEIGHFYVVDSAGVSLSSVASALDAVPPRALRLDTPPLKVPPCFRSTPMVVAAVVQWAQVVQCFELVLEDERVSGRRWDWVLRTRLDMALTQSLRPVQDYDPGFVYFCGLLAFVPAVTSWGVTQQLLPMINDRLFLVPRHLVSRFLAPMREMCPSAGGVAHLAWTPYMEYTLLHDFLQQGLPLRLFTEDPDQLVADVNRKLDKTELALSTRTGAVAPHEIHEARIARFLESQPGAFGDGWTGAAPFQPEVAGALEEAGGARIWEGHEGSGPPRVVLDPQHAFRDHVVLRRVQACVLPPATCGNACFLQVRVYRPVDAARRFWRLIGATEDLGPRLGAAASGGPCATLALAREVVAAPDDALGYVARGPFARAPSRQIAAQAPRVGLGRAGIGEFDAFPDALPGAAGLALRVQHERFPLTQVRPECFPAHDDGTENRLVSYDYCCVMETHGPAGQHSCWDTVEYGRDFSYETCCIAEQNFGGLAAGAAAGRAAADARLQRGRALVLALGGRKMELWTLLRELVSLLMDSAELGFPTPRRRMETYARLTELVPTARLPQFSAAVPFLLPALFRFPEHVCSALLSPAVAAGFRNASIADGGVAGNVTDGDATSITRVRDLFGTAEEFASSCPQFVLLHAPVIAAAL